MFDYKKTKSYLCIHTEMIPTLSCCKDLRVTLCCEALKWYLIWHFITQRNDKVKEYALLLNGAQGFRGQIWQVIHKSVHS